MTGLTALAFFLEIFVGVLFHLLRADVFIGEFAANEGAAFVSGGDAFCPLHGGQIKPLVVRTAFVGVAQKDGVLGVGRSVEDEETLFSLTGNFECFDFEFLGARLALGIAENHARGGGEVLVTRVTAFDFLGGGKPLGCSVLGAGKEWAQGDGKAECCGEVIQLQMAGG